MSDKISKTVDFLKSSGILNPDLGIILGTGLGKMAHSFEIITTIDYRKIPNFPLSTVESHSGKLIYGKLHGRNVLAMQGRFHYYEGYSLQEVTFPVRVLKALGVRYLLISNAAGSLNLNFKKGSLMLIEDHINFLPDNPLRGMNDDQQGPRFPDMSCPYSPILNRKMTNIAERENIKLHRGIYVAVMGPNLETRAEYRMFRNFADAVGMSTVPEVIVANHIGLPCAAVSVMTDECDPDNLIPAKIEDIIATAGKAEGDLVKLFSCVISETEI
ncbi:MAG TPA: purine-nucleoside phosphorylase [Bacteroidales bacterium]|nr:purine-nucleoside phosphorylase [Bacteroidales bacterium]